MFLTGNGKLNCKAILHVVGPGWGHDQNDLNLEYKECKVLGKLIQDIFLKADEFSYKSISIPAISSGKFKFPKQLCAKIFFESIKKYLLEQNEDKAKGI